MRIRSMLVAMIAGLFAAAFTLTGAPTAGAAYPTTGAFGDQLELVSPTGTVTGWTVQGIQPSNDRIPYDVKGELWESTATVTAIQGAVEPIISDMNARPGANAPDAAAPWAGGSAVNNYRAIFNVPTERGISPALLQQGDSRTGKLYFDVTGTPPERVVYNDGVRDLLFWTN